MAAFQVIVNTGCDYWTKFTSRLATHTSLSIRHIFDTDKKAVQRSVCVCVCVRGGGRNQYEQFIQRYCQELVIKQSTVLPINKDYSHTVGKHHTYVCILKAYVSNTSLL